MLPPLRGNAPQTTAAITAAGQSGIDRRRLANMNPRKNSSSESGARTTIRIPAISAVK